MPTVIFALITLPVHDHQLAAQYALHAALGLAIATAAVQGAAAVLHALQEANVVCVDGVRIGVIA